METNTFNGPVTIFNQPNFTIEIIGCYLPLTNSEKFAIVDMKYLKHLSQFKWCITENNYVMRTTGNSIYLHRYIMGLESKLNEDIRYTEVDHKDTDPLNNVVDNLRMCNRQEQVRNTNKKPNCTSMYTGVYRRNPNSRWYAHITHNSKTQGLGYYNTEIEAAMARDRALRDLPIREEFKRYNFNVL